MWKRVLGKVWIILSPWNIFQKYLIWLKVKGSTCNITPYLQWLFLSFLPFHQWRYGYSVIQPSSLPWRNPNRTFRSDQNALISPSLIETSSWIAQKKNDTDHWSAILGENSTLLNGHQVAQMMISSSTSVLEKIWQQEMLQKICYWKGPSWWNFTFLAVVGNDWVDKDLLGWALRGTISTNHTPRRASIFSSEVCKQTEQLGKKWRLLPVLKVGGNFIDQPNVDWCLSS